MPPVIDGNIIDDCWQSVRWHSDFAALGSPQQKTQPATSFPIVHDGDSLYIAACIDEPEPAKLKANISERDGWIWTDDCIEIFLDTEGKSQRYYHFVINSKGVLYDAKRVESGLSSYPEWNCSAKAAAKVEDSAWFVELSVPLAELSFSADSPASWKINVACERYVSGQQSLSTFAPLAAGTFHRPQDFASAEVKDADLTPISL